MILNMAMVTGISFLAKFMNKTLFLLLIWVFPAQVTLAKTTINTASVNVLQSIGSEDDTVSKSDVNLTNFSINYGFKYDKKNTVLELNFLSEIELDNENNAEDSNQQLDLAFNSNQIHSKRWQSNFSSHIEQRNITSTGRLLDGSNVQEHFIQNYAGTLFQSQINNQYAYSLDANIRSFGYDSTEKTEALSFNSNINSSISSKVITWDINFLSKSTDSFNNHIDNISAKSFYRINRNLKSFINLEQFTSTEDNSFNSNKRSLGLLWDISNRSSVTLDIGKLKENSTWSFEANLNSKRTRYQITHTENITNSTTSLSDNPLDLEQDTLLSDTSNVKTFIQKRDSINISHNLKRLGSNLYLFRSTRFSNFTNNSFQQLEGYALNLNYKLSRNSDLNINLSSSTDTTNTVQKKEKITSLNWTNSKLKKKIFGINSSLSISYNKKDYQNTENNTVNFYTIQWKARPAKKSTVIVQYEQSNQVSNIVLNQYNRHVLSLTYQYHF